MELCSASVIQEYVCYKCHHELNNGRQDSITWLPFLKKEILVYTVGEVKHGTDLLLQTA